jgi:hypothetical protein
MAEGKRGFELGTLLMVLVILGILVAGLWMTGKSMDARFNELNAKITARTDQIHWNIAELRKIILATHGNKAVTAPPAAVDQEAPANKKVK